MRRLVLLSSTINTGIPRRTPSGTASKPVSRASPLRNCTVKWKVLPVPGELSTHRRPPMSWTIFAEIASPRPVPPYCRVVELSACSNTLKMVCCFSGGMPIPVSLTEKCSMASSSFQLSNATDNTTSPCSVNLMELPIRFVNTCRRRPGSPATSSGTSVSTSKMSSRPFC